MKPQFLRMIEGVQVACAPLTGSYKRSLLERAAAMPEGKFLRYGDGQLSDAAFDALLSAAQSIPSRFGPKRLEMALFLRVADTLARIWPGTPGRIQAVALYVPILETFDDGTELRKAVGRRTGDLVIETCYFLYRDDVPHEGLASIELPYIALAYVDAVSHWLQSSVLPENCQLPDSSELRETHEWIRDQMFMGTWNFGADFCSLFHRVGRRIGVASR